MLLLLLLLLLLKENKTNFQNNVFRAHFRQAMDVTPREHCMAIKKVDGGKSTQGTRRQGPARETRDVSSVPRSSTFKFLSLFTCPHVCMSDACPPAISPGRTYERGR
jgi:hypothetical protein